MVYLTGDTHGNFIRVKDFCRKMEPTTDDIMIVLGDAGVNYFGEQSSDNKLKKMLSQLPITIFCIHGNHEARPWHLKSYHLIDWHGGKVWVEDKYPNILFAKDGEVYDFNGKKAIVIGGAYSVDKYYRLTRGMNWFNDEQPSDEIKMDVEKKLDEIGYKVDFVFSHTSPLSYEPREWFLQGLDQSSVDKSTEIWLDEIHSKLKCDRWYCGHYHGSKEIDEFKFMFEDFCMLGD